MGNTNADVIGGLHQKIYVENNYYGLHYGISFGMNDRDDDWQWSASGSSDAPRRGASGSGVVYKDNGKVTEIQKIFKTTPEEDRFIQEYMKDQIGKTGPYSPFTNSCRHYSDREFDKIKDMILKRRKAKRKTS